MRESCEGELCLGGLVGSHTLTIGRGYQGNHVAQRVESAPVIGGWVPGDGDTVRSNGGEGQVLWSTRRDWGRGGVGQFSVQGVLR